MKVSELTGADLDYWVAKAHGMIIMTWRKEEYWGYEPADGVHPGPRVLVKGFNPSSKWEWGGPIIERERISILPFGQAAWGAVHFGDIFVRYHDCNEKEVDSIGPTPLVAAMRAYVASKYGNEVQSE